MKLEPHTATHPIWLSSVFRLRRNLAKQPFPHKVAQHEPILNPIKESLLKQIPQATFLNAEQTTPLDKEFLFEHFLCPEGFESSFHGQGFLFDTNTLALINIRNHLELHRIDTTGEWEKAWNQLSKLESNLHLEMAYHPQFGYLTSDPAACGTALTVYCLLHLPALIHKSQELQKESDVNLTPIVGDFILLSNRYTLGVSEENILRSLHTTASKLIVAEEALRKDLSQDAAIKDEISRAYGLTLHSYQLQTQEALGALSLLKLGIALGNIQGITDQKINSLLMNCRKAHLSYLFPDTKPEDLPHKRAEYLHQELHGIELIN